jgi:hypothetical protein
MSILHERRFGHCRVSQLSGRVSGQLGMSLAGPARPEQTGPGHHFEHRARRFVRGRSHHQKNRFPMTAT